MRPCYKCGSLVPEGLSWYGLHETCFKQWFGLGQLEEFQEIASTRASDGAPVDRAINSSFFHGKFRKYSSTLGGDRYILKVEEKEYPELPATEYLCNKIFSALKITVPPFFLIQFEGGHASFVSRNFMQDYRDATLVHIYHFSIEHDCESLLNVIGEKTGRVAAQEDFVYLTLADSLIGNNDRHGRNIGLIQTPKGYELAPFYDNPSHLGVELFALLEADHQPAGAIWTKDVQEPKMKDYVREWRRLGFGRCIQQFRDLASFGDIGDLIQKSYLSEKRKKALLRLISKRFQELWT